jgi:hydroxysqualene synthase
MKPVDVKARRSRVAWRHKAWGPPCDGSGLPTIRAMSSPHPRNAEAGQHYENFPVASWLCPPALRPPIRAIYRFARTADDIADEGQATAAQRLDELARYRAQLHGVYQSLGSGLDRAVAGTQREGWPDVFGPLAKTIVQHTLPLQPLDDLLDAFLQDVRLTPDADHNPDHRWPYPDRASLLDYCRRSANPVGRLLLHLYDITDDTSLRQSDAVCTGLQLVNFWQDLSVDLPRQRWYVPQDDAVAFGLDAQTLGSEVRLAAHADLVRTLADWALAHLHEGAPLVHRLPGRIGWELRLVLQGGIWIGQRTRALGSAAFTQRPRIRAWHGPALFWRAWRM